MGLSHIGSASTNGHIVDVEAAHTRNTSSVDESGTSTSATLSLHRENHETKTTKGKGSEELQDGGYAAWFCVLGAFFALFCTFGWLNA